MSWWKFFFSTKKESTSQLYSADEIDKIISQSNYDDPLFPEAVDFVMSTRKVSISSIQRKLRIGYNRAARIVESLELNHIVSEASHNGSREVLMEDERSRRKSKDLEKEIKIERLEKEALSKIEKIILKHAKTLAVKQKQTVYKDDYDNYVVDAWIKEMDYFIEKVLLKNDVANDFLNAGSADD